VDGWNGMQFLFYDELFASTHLDPGTYIFTDTDRLTPSERSLAASIWRQLAAYRPAVRLLNDPARVPGRYELLQVLAEHGTNHFRAWCASADLTHVRFPVFIRVAHEHTGSLTPLLPGSGELARALRWTRLQGYRSSDLLVVEFCDTSDDEGVFRKYSAFVIDGEILPRHLFMSRRWLLKKPDLEDPAFELERQAFLEGNPHASRLQAICHRVGIDYGRVDYSMLGDDPQVWEINTNPTVLKLADRLTEAFARIDVVTPADDAALPITLDPSLLAARARETELERRAQRRRDLVESVHATGLTRPVRLLARALRGY
jgi:hypothetical protein